MGTMLEEPPVAMEETQSETRVSPPASPKRRSASEYIRSAFADRTMPWGDLDWKVVGWMALMHVGCIAAPFFFSWSALGICLALYWATGTIGITFCYHRFLAHRSFKMAKPVEFIAQVFGVLALQGTPSAWSSTHRVHHARSDQPGDPHSPRHGKRWSHINWLFKKRPVTHTEDYLDRIIPDLNHDPMVRFFDRTFFLWTIALSVALYAFGGMSWLLWGLCVRLVITYHATWFVNSATHLWGYRNYETKDDSRNLWWVAALTGGEGWHNNHHAYPALAIAGHRHREIDPTYMIIWTLKKMGLAWDVADEIPASARRVLEQKQS